MSNIFYHHLIIFEELEKELDQLNLDNEERQEIELLMEEILHHRIIDRILTVLPRAHHEEFLTKFHQAPHDQQLIDYIDARIEESIENHIKDEVEKIKEEIKNEVL